MASCISALPTPVFCALQSTAKGPSSKDGPADPAITSHSRTVPISRPFVSVALNARPSEGSRPRRSRSEVLRRREVNLGTDYIIYRPNGYRFADVVESVKAAKEKGLFTMINYLVSPGVTDSPSELEALLRFIEETGVDMLQMRNLSIDPAFYNERMGVQGKGIGMYRMLERVKQAFPRIQYGYFNRTREKFYPDGYEKGWPIR